MTQRNRLIKLGYICQSNMLHKPWIAKRLQIHRWICNLNEIQIFISWHFSKVTTTNFLPFCLHQASESAFQFHFTFRGHMSRVKSFHVKFGITVKIFSKPDIIAKASSNIYHCLAKIFSVEDLPSIKVIFLRNKKELQLWPCWWCTMYTMFCVIRFRDSEFRVPIKKKHFVEHFFILYIRTNCRERKLLVFLTFCWKLTINSN